MNKMTTEPVLRNGFWSRKLRTLPMDWGRLFVWFKMYHPEGTFAIIHGIAMSWDGETQIYLGGAKDSSGRLIRFPLRGDAADALRLRFREADWQFDYTTEDPPFPNEYLPDPRLEWRFTRWKPTLPIDPIPHGGFCGGCPYLEQRRDKPEDKTGYCRYLEKGDWMVPNPLGWLFDGLKACDIRRDEPKDGPVMAGTESIQS